MSDLDEIMVRGVADAELRIVIEQPARQEEGSEAEEVERVWCQLRRESPRLHDGPILLADMERLRDGELVCRRGTYKHMATAGQLGRSVRALGVCGVVVGRDTNGDEHVLFGRRGSETRIYGGMWENAPSGTVTVQDETSAVGLPELIVALREEGIEELGVDLAGANARAIATIEDPGASSVDVVLRIEVGQIDPRIQPCAAGVCGRWEYVDTAWVAVGDVGMWARMCGAAMSPPTRELLTWLDW